MFDKRFREMLMMDFATKNQGSGLLNNNTNATSGLLENTGGFFGNLGNINPNILLGANIIGQGIQGRILLVLSFRQYNKQTSTKSIYANGRNEKKNGRKQKS